MLFFLPYVLKIAYTIAKTTRLNFFNKIKIKKVGTHYIPNSLYAIFRVREFLQIFKYYKRFTYLYDSV
jgi:hypothetical protein